MQQVFRDQCRAAHTQAQTAGIVRLWLRTLPDLASTALSENLSVDLFMNAPNQPVNPISWRQMIPALLPGTLYVALTFYGTLTLSSVGVVYRDPIILGLCLVLVSVGLWHNRRAQTNFPTWAYTPLGIGICCALQMALATPAFLIVCGLALLGGAAWAIWQRRALRRLLPAQRTLKLLALATGIGMLASIWQVPNLLSAMTGAMILGLYFCALYALVLFSALPLLHRAKVSGVIPALGSIGVLYQIVMLQMEPDYALGIWIKNQAVVAGLDSLIALLFLVLAPALILRARSTHGQVHRLLSVTGLGLLAAVCIPFINTFYSANYPWSAPSILLRCSMGLGFFVTMQFLALAFHGMAVERVDA
jgi:hypothetical protein